MILICSQDEKQCSKENKPHICQTWSIDFQQSRLRNHCSIDSGPFCTSASLCTLVYRRPRSLRLWVSGSLMLPWAPFTTFPFILEVFYFQPSYSFFYLSQRPLKFLKKLPVSSGKPTIYPSFWLFLEVYHIKYVSSLALFKEFMLSRNTLQIPPHLFVVLTHRICFLSTRYLERVNTGQVERGHWALGPLIPVQLFSCCLLALGP